MRNRRFASGSIRDCAEGKPPLSRLPWEALDEVAMVHLYGDEHYGFGNWRKGQPISELLNSALRHIEDSINGVDFDSKSGQRTLAHAAWNVLVALRQQVLSGDYELLDDRLAPDGSWVNPVYAVTDEARAKSMPKAERERFMRGKDGKDCSDQC